MATIFMHRVTARAVSLVAFESAVIVASVTAATYVRLGDDAWDVIGGPDGAAKIGLVAFVCQVCLYYADLYHFRRYADRREMFMRVIQALGATSILLAVLYYWFPPLVIGRGVFMLSSAFVAASVLGWRVAFEWGTRRVAARERLLLVGTSEAALSLARELHARMQELGVEIVGFVDPDPARVGQPLINPGIIGTVDDIPALVRARNVDRVVVSLRDARGKLPMDKLLDIKLDGVQFDHLANVYEEYTGKIAIENLRPSWLIFSPGFRKTVLVRAIKRAIDVVVAAIGLVVVFPVMALIAVGIAVTSRGHVLYHQQRVGKDGRVFTVHKFRSMYDNAEAQSGAVWAQANDTRVTKFGRLLRRTRLDELPQFWNVLRGDMSLVGPRPERPEFVRMLNTEIPFYRQRQVVRPGLTGWAQVRYTYGATTEDALEKLQYDLFYIKNMSISLDLFIMVSTIKTVILRSGAQ
jgi:sugar transferase (PEP-CTERM system associated)